MQRKASQPAVEAAYERARRAQYAKLTAHYGKIGSAAVTAALLHAKCRKEKAAPEHQTEEHQTEKWIRFSDYSDARSKDQARLKG